MIYSIYLISNIVNKKVYIGYSENVERRWKEHIRSASYPNPKEKLYRAMQKYGIDNFTIEIICQSKDGDFLNKKMESYFIKKYNSYGRYSNGYNMTIGGEGHSGYKQSKKTKTKRAKKLKGQKRTDKTKQLQSLAAMGNTNGKGNLGCKHPEFSGENHPNIKMRKPYKIYYDDGTSEVIIGFKKLCLERGYTSSSLYKVIKGYWKYYKNIIKIEKLF